MREYEFVTVDVFTSERFGGNQLAVFPSAQGLATTEMQSLAREFNLSETAFVLPADSEDCDAVVRIFTRSAEMPFAGHPSIGTACVLAARNGLDRVRLKQPAGMVSVDIDRDGEGMAVGGTFDAPQALTILQDVEARVVAAAIGVNEAEVGTQTHSPVRVSVGVDFILAELSFEALRRASPDLAGFRAAALRYPEYSRFSLLAYHRSGSQVEARMFAPLGGTWEDPATGSANGALGAFLLRNAGTEKLKLTVRQGAQINRPSELSVVATCEGQEFRARVGGGCVPVMRGVAQV